MIIGITATREGLSQRQKGLFEFIMQLSKPEFVRHGDCVGGDADCYKIARANGIATIAHPPKNDKLRAYTKDNFESYPVKDYLVRNRDIVNMSDLLIGFPLSRFKKTGGTWSTIKFAKSIGKPVVYMCGDHNSISVSELNENIRTFLIPALSAYVRKFPA